MKFHKKGLLSLALSSLTFLSSCVASSSSAMNEICYVQQSNSESEKFDELDELMAYTIFLPYTSTMLIYWPIYNIEYAIIYRICNIIFRKEYLKCLKDICSIECSDSKYIKRQEGPGWCWIATIQGILKKLKPDLELSQENIYSLTHDGKQPAFFEFCRNVISDGLKYGDCTYLLGKIRKTKFQNDALYPFCILSKNPKMKSKYSYKEIMKMLIKEFGACFGIVNPIVGCWGEFHMVMLSNYDSQTETLTFEDPSFAKKYDIKFDKFAEFCESCFNKEIDWNDPNSNDIFIPFMVIGFTDDPNKSGFFKI